MGRRASSGDAKMKALQEQLESVKNLLDDMKNINESSGGDGTDSPADDRSLRSELKRVTVERDALQAQLTELLQNRRDAVETRVEATKDIISKAMQDLSEQLKGEFDSKMLQKKVSNREPRGRKVFTNRKSMLTSLLEIENYQTIMNMGVTAFVMFGINVIVNDYTDTGTIIDFSLLYSCFEGFVNMIPVWFKMWCATFLVLPIAHLGGSLNGAWKAVPCVMYVALQSFLYSTSASAVANPASKVGTATAMALLCEQTRMTMKIHSYFRERTLWNTHGFGLQPRDFFSELPTELGRYFYFMFAPTLVYRPSYPRLRGGVSWSSVVEHLAEVLVVVYFVFAIFRMLLPQILRTGSMPATMQSIALSVLSCMLPGMMLLFLAFFLVLHAWQNMFAEITGFADRQFYEDWWNSRTWAQYYRKWNGVVHDWIFNYLYLDIIDCFGVSKNVAQLAAFFFSAVVHEYIVSYTLGYFFPILLILFAGPGVIFVSLTRYKKGRFWNVFMWLMLASGTGILVMLYCREDYARTTQCLDPNASVPLLFYLVPRSFGPLLLGSEHYPLCQLPAGELLAT